MSIGYLIEKYDLSTEEGLKKAFNEIDKEEIRTIWLSLTLERQTLSTFEQNEEWDQEINEEVNESLDSLLQRQCYLGGKLRSISQAFSNLRTVQDNAEQLAEMITYTSNLAESVSAKVRQLDLARSRVAECQQRVHDLIDLQLCSEGVQTALKSEDYEKGAAHVHRFLSMDPSILQQTAADVAEGMAGVEGVEGMEGRGWADERRSVSSDAVEQACATLRAASQQLHTTIAEKFNDAVKKEDMASVERFFKIFPLLGLHEEGLEKYSLHLCTKVQELTQKSLRAANEGRANSERGTVLFADMFTQLFENIAKIIDTHQALIETYYGPGRLLLSISVLQKECDIQIRKIINEFMRHRQISKLLNQVKEYSRLNGTSTTTAAVKDKVEPKAIDVLVGELAVMHSRVVLYFKFIRRKVLNDIDVGISDPEKQKHWQNKLENVISKSELNRSAQDLLGYYLVLERYYLEENIQKAIQLDTIVEGQLHSSVIDDVFFIVRKCIRRAACTGSVDGLCAVILEGGAQLEGRACAGVRRVLRAGLPGGYLDLAELAQRLQLHSRAADTDQQRAMFLAHLNNSDLGSEYVETLCQTVMSEITQQFPHMSDSDKGKLESCLSGLSGVTVNFKSINEFGMQQLRSSAIKPRINPWIDAFNQYNYNLTEEEFAAYDSEESFVQTLLANLDTLLNSFRDQLTTANFDSLVAMVTTDCVQRWEKHIMNNNFNRLGGLVVERGVRAMSSLAGGAGWWGARERCARLTQVAALLAAERVSDAPHCAAPPHALRLSHTEIRQVLALRSDFRLEDIKRLKL